MGGFFGVASKEDCVFDLFFGTDYHSHLGTRRAGIPSSVVVLGKFRCFHVPALFCDSFLPRFSPYLQKIFYAL